VANFVSRVSQRISPPKINCPAVSSGTAIFYTDTCYEVPKKPRATYVLRSKFKLYKAVENRDPSPRVKSSSKVRVALVYIIAFRKLGEVRR